MPQTTPPPETPLLVHRGDQSRGAVEWAVSRGLVAYDDAVAAMDARVRLIADGTAAEIVWLLEHPPLYTAGTSAKPQDLLASAKLPVHWTGRGGQITYHGPGQRVAYVMLDVKTRFKGDVRAFTAALEHWLIGALKTFGVSGVAIAGRTGVWVIGGPDTHLTQTGAQSGKQSRAAVPAPLDRANKIAAIGLRIRTGISLHGVSLNVAPELTHYDAIVACGLPDSRATSLSELGCGAAMQDVDRGLRRAFETQFNTQTRDGPAPNPGDGREDNGS